MMCRMFGADDADDNGAKARDMMHSLVQVNSCGAMAIAIAISIFGLTTAVTTDNLEAEDLSGLCGLQFAFSLHPGTLFISSSPCKICNIEASFN